MKQSLQLRLRRQLSMSPQQLQATRLLQLSSSDLRLEAQQAVEGNPLLEFEDAPSAEPGEAIGKAADETYVDETYYGAARQADQDPYAQARADIPPADPYAERNDSRAHGPRALDSGFGGRYWRGGADRPQDRAAGIEADIDNNADKSADNLAAYVRSQLATLHINETDALIAEVIVDALDERGYLCLDVEEIMAALPPRLAIGADEVRVVINIVQHLDPAGVGARSLRECLMLQLRPSRGPKSAQEPLNHTTRLLALEIVERHFDALCRHDEAAIARRTRRPPGDIRAAIARIQSLNPRPGGIIDSAPTEYIIPDVWTRKTGGRWRATLNRDITPRLRVNEYYAGLIRRADDSRDNLFLKNNLREARRFLKSLARRDDTLLRVAAEIVERQSGFFELGAKAMRPLLLKDIALALDMHESTISRATTQKYMHTPHGVFEIKSFFSGRLGAADGGGHSSAAARALIKKLVHAEDTREPLSDDRLVRLLARKGIKVARRTVAKYRQRLRIPPSHQRRSRAMIF